MSRLFTTVDLVPSTLFAETMGSINSCWMMECGLLNSRVTLGNLFNLFEPQHLNLHGKKCLWKLNKIMFVSMPDTKHLFKKCLLLLLKLLPFLAMCGSNKSLMLSSDFLIWKNWHWFTFSGESAELVWGSVEDLPKRYDEGRQGQRSEGTYKRLTIMMSHGVWGWTWGCERVNG